MGTFFYVSDLIMSFQRFDDENMDRLFIILLEGLEENARFYEKRKLVNSILPMQKYKLLQRFVSREEELSQKNLLNLLPIFLEREHTF